MNSGHVAPLKTDGQSERLWQRGTLLPRLGQLTALATRVLEVCGQACERRLVSVRALPKRVARSATPAIVPRPRPQCASRPRLHPPPPRDCHPALFSVVVPHTLALRSVEASGTCVLCAATVRRGCSTRRRYGPVQEKGAAAAAAAAVGSAATKHGRYVVAACHGRCSGC